MSFFKYILISFLSLFLVSCSHPQLFDVSKKSNIINIAKDENTFIKVELTNPTYKDYGNFCINTSNVINDNHSQYGKLFFEEIDLNSDCGWKGSPISRFEHNLQFSLNLSSLQIVEEFEFNNFTFKTYLFNEKSYISFIYIYQHDENFIMLDNKGKLYEKVLKLFKPSYTNNHISKKRYDKVFTNSIAKNSMIYHYIGVKGDGDNNIDIK